LDFTALGLFGIGYDSVLQVSFGSTRSCYVRLGQPGEVVTGKDRLWELNLYVTVLCNHILNNDRTSGCHERLR